MQIIYRFFFICLLAVPCTGCLELIVVVAHVGAGTTMAVHDYNERKRRIEADRLAIQECKRKPDCDPDKLFENRGLTFENIKRTGTQLKQSMTDVVEDPAIIFQGRKQEKTKE